MYVLIAGSPDTGMQAVGPFEKAELAAGKKLLDDAFGNFVWICELPQSPGPQTTPVREWRDHVRRDGYGFVNVQIVSNLSDPWTVRGPYIGHGHSPRLYLSAPSETDLVGMMNVLGPDAAPEYFVVDKLGNDAA